MLRDDQFGELRRKEPLRRVNRDDARGRRKSPTQWPLGRGRGRLRRRGRTGAGVAVGPDAARARRPGPATYPAGRARRARPGLHPRAAAADVADREPVVPWRGPRPGQHPGLRLCAARRQPLGREHDPRHGDVHAGVQHLLRRRAALLSAGPQPGAGDAGAALAAPVRDRCRVARKRRPCARLGRGGARVSRRRPRGAPADPATQSDRLRPAPRVHPPGAASAESRSSRSSRSGARRRRCS